MIFGLMLPWWSGANLLLRLSFGVTRDPGEQDITSHVMIDQLAMLTEPTSVARQADWLIVNGLNSLAGEGRNYWQAHVTKPDLQAMLMRSRIAESESLCALDGLGNFTVLEWRK
jgi:SAM-dependent MidA family methyltransferase